MPKIKCIKSVIMTSGNREGQEAFTEGQIYNQYNYTLKDVYDFRVVQCAKNNWKERHIIIDKNHDNGEFFNEHFELSKSR